MTLKKNWPAAIALALVTSGVHAGTAVTAPVDVDLDAQFASGDMVTARYSANPDELIGCGTRFSEDGLGGVFRLGFCRAEDAEGESVTCFSTNPELLEAINAVSAYSFITFSWEDDGAGNLTCTFIGFSSQSFYLPRGLKSNKGGSPQN